jgi:hypothetical protein
MIHLLVEADIAAAGIPADQFALFLAFAHEVIDRYGRFLDLPPTQRPNGQTAPLRRTTPRGQRRRDLLHLAQRCPIRS